MTKVWVVLAQRSHGQEREALGVFADRQDAEDLVRESTHLSCEVHRCPAWATGERMPNRPGYGQRQ